MRVATVMMVGLLASTAAEATSTLHERRVAGVDPICNGAYLLEQVFEGGSVTNSISQYRLICVSGASPNRADWVLASDVRCGGDAGACETPRQIKAFNQIKAMAAHAEKTGVLELSLDRLVVGTNCKINRRSVSDCSAEQRFDGERITIYTRRLPETANPEQMFSVQFKAHKLDDGR